MKSTLKNKAKKLSLVAASAALLVGAGCNSAATTAVQTNTNVPSNMQPGEGMTSDDNASRPDPEEGAMMDAHYTDGTYDVIGHYTSPGGPETIKVSVTLKGDVIADVNVEPQATNPISVKKQGEFTAGYKTQVVGKNLNEVNVGKVAGSSLTPKGFNEAIAQIKVKAAAK